MMPQYPKAIQGLLKKGIRVVCVDRVLEAANVSSVTVDNFTGGYQATSHLIEQWDRPVYYIGYRTYPSSAGKRFEGWRAAMEDHGFHDFEADYLLKLTHREEENWTTPRRKYGEYGYEMARKLFSDASSETGWSFFVVNDATAMGIYRAARERNLAVGNEVAIVGFDDLPLAKRMTPTLSSVHLSGELLGYHGAKLVYQEMKNPQDRPIHQVLPVELRVRESSVRTKAPAEAKEWAPAASSA
jgi:DNA-binding LacI/PurR family transcriptional regulator